MATAPYLDVAAFRALTLAPATHVDEVEAQEPGWLLGKLTFHSAVINSRLAKRYAVPFAPAPNTPEAITGWLERIITWELYLKRGIEATDGQIVEIKGRAESAAAEVKEAASAPENLFELPLRNDTSTNGVTRGGPLGYSEVSPYSWSPIQRELAGDE